MAAGSDGVIAAARCAMRERRFAEAIGLFEARLAEGPADLEALLDLGICCLLSRSEGAFLRIHDEARALVAEAGALPERIARLWERYRSLVRKVTAAALVMGATTLASCSVVSSHRYSGGVYRPPAEAPADDAAKEDADAAGEE